MICLKKKESTIKKKKKETREILLMKGKKHTVILPSCVIIININPQGHNTLLFFSLFYFSFYHLFFKLIFPRKYRKILKLSLGFSWLVNYTSPFLSPPLLCFISLVSFLGFLFTTERPKQEKRDFKQYQKRDFTFRYGLVYNFH